MSVNNIVNKILEDAKRVEEEAINKAEEKAKEIKEAKNKEVASLVETSKAKAELEGINKKERLIQNAHLQVRNNKLKAKQDIIENVFEKSLEKLSNLSDDEFVEFVKNSLNNIKIEKDGVVILNSKRHKLITSRFVHKINSNLKLADADDTVLDGFIVRVDNVDYNFTFKAIVEGLKSELTSKVAKTLF